ncbi:MAG: YCF48-related protein [Arcicella sp.]|jgi:photosystem II stability/assembly factor-like uncharacterized protein|nr:YCF48-related protein [Arcicella sp.]
MKKTLLLLSLSLFSLQTYAQQCDLKIASSVAKPCEGQTITLNATGIPTNATLQWRKNGVDIDKAIATNYSANQVGTYEVKSTLTNINWNVTKTPLLPMRHFKVRDIFFLNANEGWALGDYSTLIKTIDGGNTWTDVNLGLSGGYFNNSIFFIDSKTGWIVGDSDYVYRTTDGGKTWSKVKVIAEPYINNYGYINYKNIVFQDNKKGWIVCSNGILLNTIDGGITWNKQDLGLQETLYNIVFIDELTGFVVGSSGTYMNTIDGGKTWTKQYLGTLYTFRDIVFADLQNGWIIGDGGTALKTTDGGKTWLGQNSNTVNNLRSVAFTDSKNGVAVGDYGTVVKTNDGGKTWIKNTNFPFADDYTSVFKIDSKNIWFAGNNTSLFNSTDLGTNWINKNLWKDYTMFNVFAIDDKNIWAIGMGGSILNSTDGGNTWNQINFDGSTTLLYSVYFTDTQNGWIVDFYGKIFNTTNGGKTWILDYDFKSQYAASRIFFIDKNNGWISDYSSGIIRRTTNGGKTWTNYPTGIFRINDHSFIDSQNGWLIGTFNGDLLTTKDGGQKWEKLYLFDFTPYFISFIDSKNGWVAGQKANNTYVSRTTDGGVTWNSQKIDITYVESLKFIDSQNGWLTGTNGIFKTIDGGVTWKSQNLIDNPRVTSITTNGLNNAWAASTLGRMYKLSSSTSQICTSNTITINPKPTPPTVTWSNTDAKLTATSVSAGTLTWLKGVDELKNITATTYQPTSSGSYSVRVTDANGCSEISKAVEVTILSSDNPLNESGVSVYPNPSSNGVFKVAFTRFSNEMDATMQVIGMDGLPLNTQKMIRQNNTFEGELNASNLPTGIYFLQVVSGEQKAVVKISIAK